MAKRLHKAWITQRKAHIEKLGADKAPWIVEYVDPITGKRKFETKGPELKKDRQRCGKRAAENRRDELNYQFMTGTYVAPKDQQPEALPMTWSEFIPDYLAKGLRDPRPATLAEAEKTLDHFVRLLKLGSVPVEATTAKMIADYIAARSKERGKAVESTVSPATINRELRRIKAALRTAHDWELIERVPKINSQVFVRENRKLHRFVTDDDFTRIYAACDKATVPAGLHYSAEDWWKALLGFAYHTGWRIGELMALRWADVDLDAGTAKTQAEDNKGRKDSIAPLHPVIVELLRPLRSPHPMVFRWDLERKPLLDAFHKLQAAAGISLDCANPRKHECSPACQFYGFHDLRRAFATLNATRVSGEVLQSLMRHSSYQTTQRYISIAGQLQPKLADLFVSPALLPKNTRPTRDSDDAAAG